MATPETQSVELDPFSPPFDGGLDVVENEQDRVQVLEAEIRELSAYTFDSDDKTLVGIGSSSAEDSSAVRHFASNDCTLVGIGPAERAKRAELAELARLAQEAELAPESVPAPHSELPGPFIASDDDDGVAPDRLPMRKGEPWLFALSAVLVAAAAAALLHGVIPHRAAPAVHAASTVPSLPAANESRLRNVPFEAAASSQAAAVEVPNALGPEAAQLAAPPAAVQRDKQRAATKSAGTELGALDVSSNSAAGLVLDGRPLGKAPRVIQLPSGPHTVLFVHPERGRMSVTVNVKAGRTTSASADF